MPGVMQVMMESNYFKFETNTLNNDKDLVEKSIFFEKNLSSRADNSENKRARVMDLVLVHAGDDEGQVFQV